MNSEKIYVVMGIFGAGMNEIHSAGNGTGPIPRKFGRQGNENFILICEFYALPIDKNTY